ncbi:MAG TPA: hypothetical protein VN457_07415, partial [Chlamydiales bacterium]|nr:hypothetical protein [Chlamydiales bacterium]
AYKVGLLIANPPAGVSSLIGDCLDHYLTACAQGYNATLTKDAPVYKKILGAGLLVTSMLIKLRNIGELKNLFWDPTKKFSKVQHWKILDASFSAFMGIARLSQEMFVHYVKTERAMEQERQNPRNQ